MQTSSMEALEKKADIASRLLHRIYRRLEGDRSAAATHYRARASTLLTQQTQTRSTIGIFGATGAGKSALMNALLDEELVVPTNCMRACTAVVTEISYNDSQPAYRAKVEFIGRAAWKHELGVLLKDLVDDGGNISSDHDKKGTNAALAYAKLQAVYSDLTKIQLASATVDQLMAHDATKQLGATVDIEEATPIDYHDALRVYVDSQADVIRPHQVWPLVRVVRLFLKSDVLKHGVILVDLPGVHDSNVARAAVAESYQKQCSAFLIVSTVVRAVDDMSAKQLLTDAFQQQLKLDGHCENITFICTQTDIVSVTEMARDAEVSQLLDDVNENIEQHATSIESLGTEYNGLKKSLSAVQQDLKLVDSECSKLKALLEHTEKTEVRKSIGLELQRKRHCTPPQLRSRKRKTLHGRPYFADTEGESGSEHEIESSTTAMTTEQPSCSGASSKEELSHKLANIERRRATLKEEEHRLMETIQVNRSWHDIDMQEKEMLQQEAFQICIEARNQYSRQAIKQKFAAHVKETDQEAGRQAVPEGFDPNVELRDYSELAEAFPVFCVSSRAYQKLQGRLRKEQGVQGFTCLEDTEIPQLQSHCFTAAIDLKKNALQKYIGGIDEFCRSLKVWNWNSLGLATQARANKDIEAFSKSFSRLSTTAMDLVRNHIDIHFNEKTARVVRSAQNNAIAVSNRWSKGVDIRNRDQGGLNWNTYQSVVCRDGYFVSQHGVHDFNHELTAPLMNPLVHGWETIFIRLIPSTFEKALSDFKQVLNDFLSGIRSVQADLLQLLEPQLQAYLARAQGLFDSAQEIISTHQRDINRSFKPVIVRSMLPTYARCSKRKGKGMFNRMTTDMHHGVSLAKLRMYHESIRAVQGLLNNMLEVASQQLQDDALEFCRDIKQDCLALQSVKNADLANRQKPMREAIIQMIREYESDIIAEDDAKSSDGDGQDTGALAVKSESDEDVFVVAKIKVEDSEHAVAEDHNGLPRRPSAPRLTEALIRQVVERRAEMRREAERTSSPRPAPVKYGLRHSTRTQGSHRSR